MIHFKRAKALAASTVSPMNKGILAVADATAPNVISVTCLDPTGGTTTITYRILANTSQILPVYVRSWTQTSGTTLVYELN